MHAVVRLKELIYECIGEFEKGRLRGISRSSYLDDTVKEELKNKLEQLRWKRFTMRLQTDGNNIKVTDLDRQLLGEEQYNNAVNFFASLLNPRLYGRSGRHSPRPSTPEASSSSSKSVQITRILHFTPKFPVRQSRRSSQANTTNEVSLPCTNSKALFKALQQVCFTTPNSKTAADVPPTTR